MQTPPQPTPCPKCGSRNRDYGDLIYYAFNPTRFRSWKARFFELSKRVVAIACLDCGNLELVLEEVPLAKLKEIAGHD
jgi:predicted nucleic-acid-binding Zn-ribbon protein